MTLEDFKINTPDSGQILLLREEGTNLIKGITIHRTDCSFNSYDSSLSQLTGLTVKLGNEVIVTVLNSTKYGSHYYLEVEEFNFLETINPEICIDITLEPFVENLSIDFRNSEFYPLYNNVPENLTVAALESIYKGKIEVRRGKNIYDVDRKNDAIKPTNIKGILEDTARLAEFPESNHHSLSNTTGRYLGSKTSVLDYGIISAINGTTFEGAEYPLSTSSGSICNLNSTDRKTQNYIFTQPTGKSEETSNSYPTVVLEHLYWIDTAGDTQFTSLQTSRTIHKRLDINVGDIIRVEDQDRSAPNFTEENLSYEYLKITKVNLGTNTTYIEFNRNHLTEYDPESGDFTSPDSNGGFGLTKVIGSTIYNTDSSKIFKVVDKKLWIQKTQDILIIDKTGYTIILDSNCSI